MQALKGLKGRLWEMHQYLEAVTGGRMPVNRDIVALMIISISKLLLRAEHSLVSFFYFFHPNLLLISP